MGRLVPTIATNNGHSRRLLAITEPLRKLGEKK
jgi:hypothetical protein